MRFDREQHFVDVRRHSEGQCHGDRGFWTGRGIESPPAAARRSRETAGYWALCGSDRRIVPARLGCDRLAAGGPLAVTGRHPRIGRGLSPADV
jgi:hypothetical protein